ncbi:hypothetical protein [Actinophytocola sp.]|uniref:hypothetical protein n=1 Tax=Actinophytocola sp. TaxID=1872138 RepID=UPI002D80F76E|nr:hypothetical protein [Actinophytocola sp.]HET9142009.1 hypothetical protein [Actinophytocola sp.]HEU5108059.1 hypothetical protein [Micromonosporaceae bacterium]
MTTRVVQLWGDGLVPVWDGIYRADGSARVVELGGGTRLERLTLGPSLDLEAMLSTDPDNVTHIDVVRGADVPVPDGSGHVCLGEGSLTVDLNDPDF